jgi:hypothetical protein
MKMEKKFVISAALAQAIADYLIQRPYCEVAPLVSGLSQMQPAPEVNIVETKKPSAVQK